VSELISSARNLLSLTYIYYFRSQLDKYMHSHTNPPATTPPQAGVARTVSDIPTTLGNPQLHPSIRPADRHTYTSAECEGVITFWKEGSWSRPTGGRKGKSKDQDHHAAKYMQKPNSTIWKQSDSRCASDHLCMLLEHLGDLGLLRPQFTSIAKSGQAWVRHEMKIEFPDFELCEGDWKIRRFISDKYPSWFGSRFNDNGTPMSRGQKSEKRRAKTVAPEIDKVQHADASDDDGIDAFNVGMGTSSASRDYTHHDILAGAAVASETTHSDEQSVSRDTPGVMALPFAPTQTSLLTVSSDDTTVLQTATVATDELLDEEDDRNRTQAETSQAVRDVTMDALAPAAPLVVPTAL
jgi:hypothetical protein